MRRYPHLLPQDAALWQFHLDHNPDLYSQIYYDVHVGDGRDPGDSFDPHIRRMAIQLSQRRIDAVAYTPQLIYIIEVTATTGLTAIGQLHAYPTLYQARFHPDRPLSPLLITAEFSSDTQRVFDELRIPYIIYPDFTYQPQPEQPS